MASSHIRSDLVSEDGSQQITGFAQMQADRMTCATVTATVIKAGTYVDATTYVKSGTYMQATTYVKVGTKKYIFVGDAATTPAVLAAATALVATPVRGSIYLGAGSVWIFPSDVTATKMT